MYDFPLYYIFSRETLILEGFEMNHLNREVRAPPEAESLVLNATEGCSWNKCLFCALYREKPYRALGLESLEEQIARISEKSRAQTTRIFIGEGNALSADAGFLKKLLALLNDTFPALRKVSIGSTVQDALQKKPRELKALRKAGLGQVFIGMESGDPKSLKAIGKGTNPAQIKKAGAQIQDAGTELALSVLIGAGGRRNRKDHIEKTAALLGSITPHTLSIRTLTLMPGTPFFRNVKRGEYANPTPIEAVIEMRRLISELDLSGTFVHSRHPSNAVRFSGEFPEKKDDILFSLDRALNNPADEFLDTEYFNRG